jgi:alpha-1,3/alpha-1,6-mannosyltransferase
LADRVLVNSRFTAARLREAFPRLAARAPIVLHPGVDPLPCPDLEPAPGPEPFTLLALGRFDPRKNLQLAIDALAVLRAQNGAAPGAGARLVIAGHCDSRLREQVRTAEDLESHAMRLGLAEHVIVQRSLDEPERQALLAGCRAVVYTPVGEHFGYVPVEAMAAGRPVVAVDGAGPAETVLDGRTGFLCPPEPAAFAAALARLAGDPAEAARLGRAGRAHVAQNFSRAAFGRGLEAILREVAC